MSAAGRDWLASLEGGYRLEAYPDTAGTPTLGAGNTRWLDGRRVRLGESWTLQQAQMSFGITVASYEDLVDAGCRDDLTQIEFDALVACAFNIGPEGFMRGGRGPGGSSTLRRYVNERRSSARVRAAFLGWRYAD